MPEDNCLFCRMINGEVAADVLYQDARAVAIRDINPQAPVHALVIPKEHVESLDEIGQRDEALMGHLMRVASRVANEQGLAETGYRTVVNTGAGAGQSVFHLHVHVLGGRDLAWPPG
ncbi:MAG TPA: histidine triad nucleotide-binding protein [Pyrinomonadaceae bacterium]